MNGMMNSAMNSEPTIAATMVTGSTRMNLPGPPGSAISGRNAKISVAVQPMMATKIWRVPASAACDPRLALAQVARDVLDHDDGIVDQQAERDHEARDGDLVERVAEEVQHRDAERERQRNGDHHDAGRAPAERQQRQRDERDGDAEVLVEPREALADVARLVEAAFERDALRQAALEARDRGVQRGRCTLEDVVAVFLVRRDEHRALAVEARDVAPRLRLPAHARDVADAHGAAVHRATTVSRTSSSEV